MTLPITFRGVAYPSIRAAALDHGLCVTSLWRAVQQGAPNMAGKQPRRSKPIPVTINGIEYQSFTAAAAALGYDKTTIASYARRLGYNFRIFRKANSPATGQCDPAQPGNPTGTRSDVTTHAVVAVPLTGPGALNPLPANGGM